MAWSREYFTLVAEVINRKIKDKELKTNVCKAFAEEFKYKNAQFKEELFMKRCLEDIPGQ